MRGRARLGLLIGPPRGGGTGDQRNLLEPADPPEGWRILCKPAQGTGGIRGVKGRMINLQKS